MPKNEVKPEAKPEAAEPYIETTALGGPIPHMGDGPSPCRLQLSHEALKAAGMGPNFEVELVARPGEILVRLFRAPKPSALNTPRPTRNPGIIDELMEVTRERMARQKFAREGGWLDVGDEEPEEPLSEEQTRQAPSEQNAQVDRSDEELLSAGQLDQEEL